MLIILIASHYSSYFYQVTDYRTAVSGVRPEDLKGAPQFKEIQSEVSELIKGRILVGHALKHDMKVLFLDHPKKMIRDTAKYKPFKAAFGGRTPSLKNLAERFLGVAVQTGEHSSVQDSQVENQKETLLVILAFLILRLLSGCTQCSGRSGRLKGKQNNQKIKILRSLEQNQNQRNLLSLSWQLIHWGREPCTALVIQMRINLIVILNFK